MQLRRYQAHVHLVTAVNCVLQGGEIIRDLRNETGTKIKIEDPTPDCEDRVVTILGPDRQADDQNLPDLALLSTHHDASKQLFHYSCQTHSSNPHLP